MGERGIVERVDVVVVGAGMAGASAAYELSAGARVVVLERESQTGYHSTGRSAALYTQTYGPPVIRALTVASWDFHMRPPAGFADHAMLTPRGVLIVGRAGEAARLDAEYEQGRRLTPSVERYDADAVLARAPFLRPGYAIGGVWEPEARDIDVHALHQGYLRGLKARGGRVVTDAEVRTLTRRDGLWVADTAAGTFAAPVLVNAAGGWADELARLAGVAPVGLVPKRRTAVTFDPVFGDPADKAGLDGWPMVTDVAETFYVKPDAGRLLASPCDQTPVAPCDVQPEDLDVAEVVERVELASRFAVRRLTHKWAGLRSFVADKTPVVGFAPGADGFLWLAGQGGYGIQTAPAMGRVAAALALGRPLPDDVRALGVAEPDLSPARLEV